MIGKCKSITVSQTVYSTIHNSIIFDCQLIFPTLAPAAGQIYLAVSADTHTHTHVQIHTHSQTERQTHKRLGKQKEFLPMCLIFQLSIHQSDINTFTEISWWWRCRMSMYSLQPFPLLTILLIPFHWHSSYFPELFLSSFNFFNSCSCA